MQMKKAGARKPVPLIGTEQITGGLHSSTGDGPITNSPLNSGHFNPKENPSSGKKGK